MRCKFLNEHRLVEGGAVNEIDERLIEHVDKCSTCQAKLEAIAASAGDWLNEAQTVWRAEGLPHAVEAKPSTTVPHIFPKVETNSGHYDFESIPLDYLAEPTHPELIGRLGRYDIEAVLGSGGMGVVFKARDTDLQRVVAIKVLAKHLAHFGSARQRFAREAQAAAAIIHPNVISIFDVSSENNPPYLVMRFVSGPSLQARIDRDGPLSVLETLRIAQQVAAGLAAAHAHGVVHRDVKPANILLEERTDRVHLSDFGLARTADDASITRTGYIAGTPHYMSPEQADGKPIDGRSDLFSLGSVIYFMLTGRPPFRADGPMAILRRVCHESHRDVRQIEPRVPKEVARIVDRLLHKNPLQRYASAAELETILNTLLAKLQQGELSRSWRERILATAFRRNRFTRSNEKAMASPETSFRGRPTKTLAWTTVFATVIGMFAFVYLPGYSRPSRVGKPSERGMRSRAAQTTPAFPHHSGPQPVTAKPYLAAPLTSNTWSLPVDASGSVYSPGAIPTSNDRPILMTSLHGDADAFWNSLREIRTLISEVEQASPSDLLKWQLSTTNETFESELRQLDKEIGTLESNRIEGPRSSY